MERLAATRRVFYEETIAKPKQNPPSSLGPPEPLAELQHPGISISCCTEHQRLAGLKHVFTLGCPHSSVPRWV